MIKPISREEIKRVAFSMNPSKARGEDRSLDTSFNIIGV